MEGCPRSLMLKLELKESQPTLFAPTLKRYIREVYQEDGEVYSNQCTQLEQLRTTVIKPSYDNSGCNLLRRYYGQMHLLKSRFRMDEGSAGAVEFTWTDLYTEDPITIADVSYEQSAILFNLGALHSLLGSQEDRVSEEGMKVACTHYQSAAGAFTYLKENFSTDQYSDTSKDLLTLYINVMLGQAQECLLEKSMLDNRKNSLVARIAMQVQNYYTEAIACLASSYGEILPPKMYKHWSKTLQIKCAYLTALAYMYMSNTSEEQGKYGEKVAFMKIAAQKVNEAQKLSKGQPQQIQDVLQFITDVVGQKLDGAKRDNDFIYHETEPAATALPEVKGASLVKPIPFQPYEASMGKDIFEKLIPIKAHESSSLYSEEKANLLRRYSSIVSEKDKKLGTWLASMHIDDLLRPEEADNLPVDLTSKCEALKSNPGAIKKATEMLSKLKTKGSELEEALETTRKEISDLQRQEKSLTEQYSLKFDDKLKEFLEELDNYEKKHLEAKKTNDELAKAFEAHRHNLELLIGPEEALHAILPSQNILDSPIEDDAVQRIRDLLVKIEKMKNQRSQFLGNLRDQVNKDDITHQIATKDDADLQGLFKEELKKHDETCELLQYNLDAQEKIMKALTEANAKYAHARRSVAEIKKKRGIVVKSLVGSYDFFINFKEKVSNGVTFYNQLAQIYVKRQEEMISVCKIEKESLEKVEEIAKRRKEEKERKSSEFKSSIPSQPSVPPEVRNNPGNPQIPPQSPVSPSGYPPRPPQPIPGHPGQVVPPNLNHPMSPTGYVPRSLGGVPTILQQPRPILHNQPRPIHLPGGFPQAQQPGHVPPSSHHSRLNMSQPAPRPPPTLLTSTPRMSYPHPLFTSSAPQGPRHRAPAAQFPWQPSPGGRPGETVPPSLENPQFHPSSMPQHGKGPPNVTQVPQDVSMHPSLSSNLQQFPVRPPMSVAPPPSSQGYLGQIYQTPGEQHQALLSRQQRSQWEHGKGTHANQYIRGPLQQNIPYQPPMLPKKLSHQPPPPSHQQLLPQQLPPSRSQPLAQQLQPPLLQRPPHQPMQPPPGQQPQYQPKLHQQPPHQQQNTIPSHQPLLYQQHPPSVGNQQLGQHQQPQRQYQPPPHQFPHQPQPPMLQPQTAQQPAYQQKQLLPQQPQLKKQPNYQVPPGAHQPGHKLQQVSYQPPPLRQAPTSQKPPYGQPPQDNNQVPPRHLLGQNQFHQQATQIQQPYQPQRAEQQYSPKLQPVPHQGAKRADEREQQMFRDHQQQHQLWQQQQYKPPPQQQQPPPQQQQPPPSPQQQQQRSHQQQQQQQQQPPPQQQQQSPQQQPPPSSHQQQTFQPYGQSRPTPLGTNILHPVGPNPQPPVSSHFHPTPSSVPPPPHSVAPQPFATTAYSLPSSSSPNQTTSQVHSPKLFTQQNTPPPNSQSQTVPPRSLEEAYFPRVSSQTIVNPPKKYFPAGNHSENTVEEIPESQSKKGSEPYRIEPAVPGSFQAVHPTPSSSTGSSRIFLPPSSSNQDFSSDTMSAGSVEERQFGKQKDGGGAQLYLPAPVPSSKLQSFPQPGDVAKTQSHGETEARSQDKVFNFESSHSTPTIPQASLDDKLLENLKSLDLSQPSAQENLPGSNSPGSSNPGSNNPGVDVPSSQGDIQKIQQKVLQQQQLLIEQQQRFLEQQTHGEQSQQVSQLMEQIKHQQKELEELRIEMKLKDQFGEIEKYLENIDRRQKTGEPAKGETVKERSEEKEVPVEWKTTPGHESRSLNERDDSESGMTPKAEDLVPVGETDQTLQSTYKGTKPDDILARQFSEFLETPSHGKGYSMISSSTDDASLTAPAMPEWKHNSPGNTGLLPEILPEEAPATSLQSFEDNPRELAPRPLSGSTSDPGTSYSALLPAILPSVSRSAEHLADNDGNLPTTAKSVAEEEPPPKPGRRRPLPPKPAFVSPVHQQERQEVEDILARITQERPDARTGGASSISVKRSNFEAQGRGKDYLLRLAGEVDEYRTRVNNLTRRQVHGPSTLTKEWLSVQHYQDTVAKALTCDIGKKNTTKNRYLDILPYDQTRVILEGKGDSDYINATMIENLTPLSAKYIASQGPIPQCFTDFWSMVWQKKCPLIIMLTKEVEGKRLKCHQYWPKDEGHSMHFGSLRITMKRQTSLTFWKERLVYITHDQSQEVHIVEHYQFTGWPDHGVPNNPSDFFTFMGHIYVRHQSIDSEMQSPILLHCSAGVGRTGAFIVIYSALRELYGGNGIMDVQTLVKKLREKRKYMVQKKEQYEFCYKAILYSAEQFLILENTENSPSADSSISSSSSSEGDSSESFASSDDETNEKPKLPSRNPADKPKMMPAGGPSNPGGSHPNSGRQSAQVEPVRESGNTALNDFKEIRTTGFLNDDEGLGKMEENAARAPTEFGGEGAGEAVEVTPPHDASSSREAADMGETKYKEIIEEPEKEPEKESVASESTSIIPGLQEIQEGDVKGNCDNVAEAEKGSAEFEVGLATEETTVKDGKRGAVDETTTRDAGASVGAGIHESTRRSESSGQDPAGDDAQYHDAQAASADVVQGNSFEICAASPGAGILRELSSTSESEVSEKDTVSEVLRNDYAQAECTDVAHGDPFEIPAGLASTGSAIFAGLTHAKDSNKTENVENLSEISENGCPLNVKSSEADQEHVILEFGHASEWNNEGCIEKNGQLHSEGSEIQEGLSEIDIEKEP